MGSPPASGAKKAVPKFLSVSNIVIAPARTGRERTNKNTGTFVAYCWAEIPGYSKFGRYRGNGSSDGPYIHLGFRPAFVIYKKSHGGSDNWEMQNTTIDTVNPVNESMYPNTSGAQSLVEILTFYQTDLK